MKKLFVIMLSIVCVLNMLQAPAGADTTDDAGREIETAITLEEAAYEIRSAATLEKQLAMLFDLSFKFAGELENGGWDMDLNITPAEEIPSEFIPDTEHAKRADSLPDALKDVRYIVLYQFGDREEYTVLGDFFVRMPEKNRASSLEEVDAVLLLNEKLVSRDDYVGSAFDRVYAIYAAAVNGETVQIYEDVEIPSLIGTGSLSGDRVPMETLWQQVQPGFFGSEMVLEYPEGTAAFRITGEGCCMTALEGTFTQYEIPAEVNGYPVTGIGKINCDTLERLVLPEGIIYISGDYAIQCRNLVYMNFPSTLKRITGDQAICNTVPLMALDLNDGLEEIGDTSIMGGSSILSIQIPSSLTVLPECFLNQGAHCLWLVVPYSVTALKRRFLWVNGWVQYVFIPSEVTYFGDQIMTDKTVCIYTPEGSPAAKWAEENGHEWVACETPDDMPKPDVRYEGAFTYFINENEEAVLLKYNGEEEEVIIPDSLGGQPVTSIYQAAFCECDTVKTVHVPDTVKRLYRLAFWYCSNLRSLYLPESVVEIEYSPNASVTQCDRCTIYAPEGSEAYRFAIEVLEQNP